MNETEFTTALHACLDARRDPLDDDALRGHLADHPEELEGFAALRERLAVLPGLAPAACAPQRPARSRLLLAGTFALAATGVLGLLWSSTGAATPTVRGILAASLEEVRPRAGAALSFTVRQVWHTSLSPAATDTTVPNSTIETYELRSERR